MERISNVKCWLFENSTFFILFFFTLWSKQPLLTLEEKERNEKGKREKEKARLALVIYFILGAKRKAALLGKFGIAGRCGQGAFVVMCIV